MSSRCRDYEAEVDFEILKGQTLESILNKGDQIIFKTTTGNIYRQIYYDDCCASCSVEEIHGDLADMIGVPILMAEEVSSNTPYKELVALRAKEKAEDEYFYVPESETWTFYKMATIKGQVTIRWYGSSNGYYSESPTFETCDEFES